MFTRIGHKGAAGYEPENTIRSFQKAIDLEVDVIELDVHICKSGEVVVIHDDKVDRTTDGNGYVSDKTLAELKQLNIGENERIPTLKEVLDFVNRRTKLNIELKGEDIVEPVFDVIGEYVKNKNWQYDDFLVSSFDHYKLLNFNKLNPEIKTSALIEGIPIGYSEFAKKINAYSVNLSASFINQEFVDDAHKNNFKVFVWTVDDLDDIEKMKNLGVDGIVSNFPDRI